MASKFTFEKKVGVKPVISKENNCRAKLKIKREHLNCGGIVHGGVITTLCDVALAGAVDKSLKKEEYCVTVQLNVQFMEPAHLGETIFGYSKLVRRGRTLAFVEGYLETNTKRKIAKANGIWFIKR